MGRLTLVLGGARSGKSRYAEGLIQAVPAPWEYVATAQALDEEMRDRINRHIARRGADWQTIEAPLAVAEAVMKAEERPVLVDCLTLWLTNLLLGDHDIEAFVGEFETMLRQRQGMTVLVANEVGYGIVPADALTRRFRDEAGRLNQRMAALADRVVLVVAGLPMLVKSA